jgi:hypothetical protein
MKLRNVLALCPAVLIFSIAAGHGQPLARVTIRSFSQLSNAVVRVVGAVAPEVKGKVGGQLTAGLGLTNMATFDPNGPWEMAVWQPGGSPKPLMALRGPIPDVKEFHSDLEPDGLLAKSGEDWVQLGKASAAIVFTAADEQSDQEKAELKQWEGETIARPAQTMELRLEPGAAAKAQFLPMLAIARMAVSQQMEATVTNGVNPKAFGDLFGLYFDGIETFVKGLHEFKLGVGVDADSLVLEESVSAEPDSDLARWIHKPAYPLRAEDVKGLTPDALASAAVTIDKTERMMQVMRKVVRLSMAMQSAETNQASMNEMMELVDISLPMRVWGSVFFKEHVEFSGAYRYPASSAAEVYGKMKPLLKQLVKTWAGHKKLYSAASFTEKASTVGHIPVDRFSLTVNLKSPLYRQPQQKKQIEAMFPNGKMAVDYALKDNELLVATPERMQGLIEGTSQPEERPAFRTDDATVAMGYLNVAQAIRHAFSVSAGLPQAHAIKERLAKLETKGTAIRFRLEMNRQARGEERMPLKLLEEIGSIKQASK